MPKSRSRADRGQYATPPFISVCLIAKNEEAFIGRALASARDLEGEVLLGDTGSTDRTVAIARQAGVTVFHVPWRDDFAAAKNAVLEHARGRWIVFMDADEWFRDGDARTLRQIIVSADKNPRIVGMNVYQTNLGSLDEGDVVDRAKTVRVFRNRKQHRYVHPIHEQILDALKGTIADTPIELMHAGFIASVVAGKKKAERNIGLLKDYIASLSADNPHQRYLAMQLGREYQRASDHEQARVLYEAATENFFAAADVGPSPFASVLFGFLCEVLLVLKDYEAVLAACERFRDYVPAAQADLLYFEAVALTAIGDTEKAARRYMMAAAVVEQNPLSQEWMTTQRLMMAYAGAAYCLQTLQQAPLACDVAARGFRHFPVSEPIANVVVMCLRTMSEGEQQAVLTGLEERSIATCAKIALFAGDEALCLHLAQTVRARGESAALVFEAVAALRVGRPRDALDFLAGLSARAAAEPLARRTHAAAWVLCGEIQAFHDALRAEPDVRVAQALRRWAGLPEPDDDACVAEEALPGLIAELPLPPVPGAAGVPLRTAIKAEGLPGAAVDA